MMIHEITAKVGKYKNRKRLGRGDGTGQGGTAGRGHKGAKSRAGFSYRPHFEGGQMQFFRRIPKRGFTNVQFRTNYHVINVQVLEQACEAGANVTAETLAAMGIIRDAKQPLKILGEGEITKSLTVTAAKFSKSAKEKIEKAGGTATEKAYRTKWKRDRSKTNKSDNSKGDDSQS